MINKPFPCVWPKWPFYLADTLVVAAAAHWFLRWRGPSDVWGVLSLVVCLAAGAFLSLIPHWGDASCSQAQPFAEPESEDAPTSEPADHPLALAEVAVLAWRIRKRAESDPETHRAIARNASKILEALAGCGVEVVSYLGRKIDAGSNVEILDAVDGEYNRVLEESDPQVQWQGHLVRRALVTVGKGDSNPTSGSSGGNLSS